MSGPLDMNNNPINMRTASLIDPGSGIPNYVIGMVPTPNGAAPTTTVDISSGEAKALGKLVISPAVFTKKLNAVWAAGSGNGGLDVGVVANSSTYHVWSIRKISDQSPEFLLSLSPSAPTVPAGYELICRVGSFLTNASGQIIPWKQYGNRVKLDLAAAEYSLTTSFNNPSFSPASAPDGISVDLQAIVATSVGANSSANHRADTAQDTTSIGWASLYFNSGSTTVIASQIGQTIRSTSAGLIWVRGDITIGTATLSLYIAGWADYTVPRIGA